MLHQSLQSSQTLGQFFERLYVMQLHGVFQDDSKVYFAMVSHSVLGGSLVITILGFDET